MRSYQGWWTRFNEPDPWEGSYDLSDPQSFNRYSYCENDPVNFVDPMGMFRQGPCRSGYDYATGACRDTDGGGGGVNWLLWRFYFGSSPQPSISDDWSGGGGGGGGAPMPVLTQTVSIKGPCNVPDFASLSQAKQSQLEQLGVSASQWNSLSNNQRLGFFNFTGAIAAAGLSLSGWRVHWDAGGIQQDRTFFVAGAGATNLLVQVQASNPFSRDTGDGHGAYHGAYSESYRRNVFSKSLQLSFTRDSKYLDADIDRFSPLAFDRLSHVGKMFHRSVVCGCKTRVPARATPQNDRMD